MPKLSTIPQFPAQLLVLLGALILLLLAGCSSLQSSLQLSTCDNCGATFQGAGYYDALRDSDYTLCPECAEDYYAPLPYEQFAK